MNINDILAELGNQMGLDGLKLDENRVSRLVFDKKYAVDIEASDDMKTVHIYSVIGNVPPENKEALYEILLEANLFGKGTGGSAFSIDNKHSEIYLCRAFDMDTTDYQLFVNTLEAFVNHVETWTENIDSGSVFQEADLSSSSSSSSSLGEDPASGFIKA